MNNLFICSTPLQALIADRIMEARQLAKADCALLFLVDSDSSKMRTYFDRLAGKCAESRFQAMAGRRFRLNMMDAARHYAGRHFRAVFLAATNYPYVQMALSSIIFDDLYTFDDGTSNLSATGPYTRPFGLRLRLVLKAWLFGNRFHQARIRKLSRAHYTVFGGMKSNALAPTIPITLVEIGSPRPDSPACALVLGTVIRDIARDPENHLREQISRLTRSLPGTVYYLPHPRGEPIEELEAYTLHSDLVAEDIIIDLLQRHSLVHLYGPGSATQLMFIAEPRIRNHLLKAADMRPAFLDIIDDTARQFGIDCIDLQHLRTTT